MPLNSGMDAGKRNPSRVNDAIHKGIQRCRQSLAPIVVLAQVVDDLRMDPTWSQQDVRLVELGMRRILARLVARQPTERPPNAQVGEVTKPPPA